MNRKTMLPLVLLIVWTCVAADCNVSYSSAKITDATLTKEVNADKEAIGSANSFEQTVPVIHCVVKLANAPEDTKLKARWSVVNVAGEQPNSKIVESDIDAVGKNNIIDFTFKPNPGGMPAGEYKVDVFLNPQAGKEDQPTKSLPFTIIKSAASPAPNAIEEKEEK
jgi:hypothetical protein